MYKYFLLLSFAVFFGGCASGPSDRMAQLPPDPPLAEPVYSKQDWGLATPGAIEFWISSPQHYKYSWNIVRMWFPESGGIKDADDREIWHIHMSRDPARWEYTKTGLRAECSIPGGGKFIRLVEKKPDGLHLTMTFQNDGGVRWKEAYGGSCLQMSAAPDYEDNVGERTYWVLDGVLTPTFHTAITDPGMRGACTVGQAIKMKGGTMKTVSEGVVFIVSKDGKYVLGYSWQPAAGLFYNRAGIVACVHVQPRSFEVPPGTSRSAQGIIFIHEGSLEEAYQRFRAWKARQAEASKSSPCLSASVVRNPD